MVVLTKEDKDTIRQAIITLQTKGWIQYRLRNSQGVCLLGAFNKSGVSSISHRVYWKLFRLAGRTALASWNDREGRTQEEVISLLERALNS